MVDRLIDYRRSLFSRFQKKNREVKDLEKKLSRKLITRNLKPWCNTLLFTLSRGCVAFAGEPASGFQLDPLPIPSRLPYSNGRLRPLKKTLRCRKKHTVAESRQLQRLGLFFRIIQHIEKRHLVNAELCINNVMVRKRNRSTCF